MAEHAWISVKTRLPKPNYNCWIYDVDKYVQKGYLLLNRTWSDDRDKYSEREDPMPVVTHWMDYYTPEPPEARQTIEAALENIEESEDGELHEGYPC